MVRRFGWKDAKGRKSFRHTIAGKSDRFRVEADGEQIVVRPVRGNGLIPYWTWEVCNGTVRIDFDAREAKAGSKGFRNHGTKFRVQPENICRLYARKERLC